MQMMKTLLMGAGAVGAASVALVAVPDHDAEKSANASSAESEICLKGDLELFEGVSSKCFSRDELLALRDRPVVDMQGQPVAVSMSHPTDMSMPAEDCRTCRDYSEMSFDGWYALSSREMRREAYFVRACGILAALANAQPAGATYFSNGSPEAEEVALFAGTMKFGEAGPSEDIHVEKTPGAIWRISSGDMNWLIHEIANADFDNDGVEEIMIFTAGAPEGGTASFYSAGLLEKDTAGAALSFTPVSYGRDKAAGAGL
ncbi:hypothetical protein ACFOOP_17785 [Marinicaulis aureus]|uniref:VCBS repeat-containing protein n=1 Tax=Hyphococcus aureus TaxID=2666033 RepID=A0ABW1KWE7_9PROT